ncbi:Hypothetical predicted protein [Olea europaea subsp. europaea]|uniref:Uncharacterized protein n=1 Tax=Olea europaea subsp. europaea TaxID=158383 RepID=A0A8S0S0I3_OLEEU|nr:Hypothetical predicted protein [Olea europaea subsp. europaea]
MAWQDCLSWVYCYILRKCTNDVSYAGCPITSRAERVVRDMWYQSKSTLNVALLVYLRLTAYVPAQKILGPQTCGKAVGKYVESRMESFEDDRYWGIRYAVLSAA